MPSGHPWEIFSRQPDLRGQRLKKSKLESRFWEWFEVIAEAVACGWRKRVMRSRLITLIKLIMFKRSKRSQQKQPKLANEYSNEYSFVEGKRGILSFLKKYTMQTLKWFMKSVYYRKMLILYLEASIKVYFIWSNYFKNPYEKTGKKHTKLSTKIAIKGQEYAYPVFRVYYYHTVNIYTVFIAYSIYTHLWYICIYIDI